MFSSAPKRSVTSAVKSSLNVASSTGSARFPAPTTTVSSTTTISTTASLNTFIPRSSFSTASSTSTTTPSRAVIPPEIFSFKKQLDIGTSEVVSWAQFESLKSTSSDLITNYLSTEDYNRLMIIANSGIVKKSSKDQAKAVEQVYGLMKSTSSNNNVLASPDSTSFALLLEARAKVGDAKGVEAVLKEASSAGAALTQQHVLLNKMIAYGTAGDRATAFALLDEYRELLHPHESHGKNPDGTQAISRNKAKELVREATKAQWLEFARGKISDLNFAEVTRDLPTSANPKRKPPLPKDAPRSLVLKRKQAKKNMVKADHGAILDSHNALLKVLSRAKDREGAETLLSKMKEHGPSPTNTSYSHVMMAVAVEGDIARCKQLYQEAVEKQMLKPSRVLMNHILLAALNANDLDTAADIVESMKTTFDAPDSTTLRYMVDLYARKGDASATWSTSATLMGAEGGRRVNVFDIAQKLVSVTEPLEGGSLVETWDAYSSSVELPVQKNTLYGMALAGYARAGNVDAVRLFSQAFDVASQEAEDQEGAISGAKVAYGAAIRGLVGAGNVIEAALLFDNARKKDLFELPAPVYADLIRGLSGADVEGKEAMVQGLADLMLAGQVGGPPPLALKDSATTKTPAKNPFEHVRKPLEDLFLSMTDLQAQPADDVLWTCVSKQSKGLCSIEVHKSTKHEFCFRIIAELEGTPEEAFDLLSDVRGRPTWDKMCEEAGIVKVLGNGSKVQYMYTKGVWPTAPRDALVVGFIRRLTDRPGYLNVTQSIPTFPGFQPRPSAVRMNAEIAGQIVEPHPEGGEKRCRVIQIMKGDLGGTLPKSIIAMITTQTMPLSLRAVNGILRRTEEQRKESRLILDAETNVRVEEEEGQQTLTVADEGASEATVKSRQGRDGNAGGVEKTVYKIGSLDVTGVVDAFTGSRQVLQVIQPFLVAAVVVSLFIGRNRRA
ncbi:hypothetical protein HDV05_003652 [Chytridiales sp. JEL 0842]|nr:hypothetical protein HDV05_003652 [Chytridiales sp. JEL 0842]